jgi:hypothetical protein
VEENGKNLQFADDALRADPDTVLAAVAQTGEALKYAADERRSDRATILAAADGCKGDVEILRHMLRFVGQDVVRFPLSSAVATAVAVAVAVFLSVSPPALSPRYSRLIPCHPISSRVTPYHPVSPVLSFVALTVALLPFFWDLLDC